MLRCKHCKAKIENENLYRCPSCGKKLEKKEKAVNKGNVNLLLLAVVSLVYYIINFLSLFFKCGYYNTACIISAMILFLIALPFIYADKFGTGRVLPRTFGVLITVPFIADKFISFLPKMDTMAIDALSTVYYFFVPAAVILCAILLIMDVPALINEKVSSGICLFLALAGFLFTCIFYGYTHDVKAFAAVVIAVNALMPCYCAYHIIKFTGNSSGKNK